MTEKTENGVSALDTVKLVLAAALLIGGIAGYYYYATASVFVRGGALLLGAAAAIGVGMLSEPGRALWRFTQAARVELRKVVWPTWVETRQTTIAVIVFVIIMGFFFFGLDALLGWALHMLTGREG